MATGVAAVDALLKTLADVAGWRLQVRAAGGDGDGRALSETSGPPSARPWRRPWGRRGRRRRRERRRHGLRRHEFEEGVDVGRPRRRRVRRRVLRGGATSHPHASSATLARAAGLRLHVAAPGVLPAADADGGAARRGRLGAAPGAAARIFLQQATSLDVIRATTARRLLRKLSGPARLGERVFTNAAVTGRRAAIYAHENLTSSSIAATSSASPCSQTSCARM